jgi:hypothetical protein
MWTALGIGSILLPLGLAETAVASDPAGPVGLPPPVQRANPDPQGGGDAYWTEERLRRARPKELPRAPGPPPAPTDEVPGAAEGAGSTVGAGSPPVEGGASAPDLNNRLFPPSGPASAGGEK